MPKTNTILSIYESNVKKHPRKIFLFEKEPLTYFEFDKKVNLIANIIKIQKEKIIPICLNNDIDTITSIIAVWKTGKAFTIIDRNYPEEKKKFIINFIDSKFIIDDNFFACVKNKNLPILEFKSVLPNKNQLASLIWTSGTTGNPKAVMLTHQNLFLATTEMSKYFSKTKHWINISNISFIGCQINIFNAIMNKITFIIRDTNFSYKKESLLDLKSKLKNVKKFSTEIPPQLLYIKFHNKEIYEDMIDSILTGSDIVSYIFSKKIKIYCVYGMSETAKMGSIFLIDKKYNTTPIGRGTSCVNTYLLDKNNKLITTPNVVGQICMSGNITPGYFKNDEETNKKIISNPFKDGFDKLLLSGDLGFWNSEKQLVYKQRADFIFNISGKRIDPSEIEKQVLKIPGISGCVVFPVNFSQITKVPNDLRICCNFVSNNSYSSKELRQILSKKLPTNLIPSYFAQIKKIPLTSRGKVDRRSCINNFNISSMIKNKFKNLKKSTNEEETIKQIYSNILGIQKKSINNNDTFVQLGGNSLLSIYAVQEISKKAGIALSIEQFNKDSSVKTMSLLIKNPKQKEQIKKVKFCNQVLPGENFWIYYLVGKNFTYSNDESLLNICPLCYTAECNEMIEPNILKKTIQNVFDYYLNPFFEYKISKSKLNIKKSTFNINDCFSTYYVKKSDEYKNTLKKIMNNYDSYAKKPFNFILIKKKPNDIFCCIFNHLYFDMGSMDTFFESISEAYYMLKDQKTINSVQCFGPLTSTRNELINSLNKTIKIEKNYNFSNNANSFNKKILKNFEFSTHNTMSVLEFQINFPNSIVRDKIEILCMHSLSNALSKALKIKKTMFVYTNNFRFYNLFNLSFSNSLGLFTVPKNISVNSSKKLHNSINQITKFINDSKTNIFKDLKKQIIFFKNQKCTSEYKNYSLILFNKFIESDTLKHKLFNPNDGSCLLRKMFFDKRNKNIKPSPIIRFEIHPTDEKITIRLTHFYSKQKIAILFNDFKNELLKNIKFLNY